MHVKYTINHDKKVTVWCQDYDGEWIPYWQWARKKEKESAEIIKWGAACLFIMIITFMLQ